MTTTQAASLIDRIADLAAEEGVEIGFAARHVQSGRSIELNAEDPFPTASVFKVPVMLEVLRQIEEGRLALDQRLELLTEDKTLNTGVLLTLDDGLRPTLRDLMTLMIIISDNTATTMLLNLVGKQAVQDVLLQLGCTDSTVTMNVHEMFLHAWHLPLDRHVGVPELIDAARSRQMDYGSLTFARTRDNTISTAADMARLMAAIAEGGAPSPWVSTEARRILFLTQTTDRVPRYLEYRTVGNKTGTFRGLRNDCGLIVRAPDDEIAYAVFTFDPRPLPLADAQLAARRNTAVAEMMGRIGLILQEEFKP